MQGGLTPAGDFSPPNILKETCMPDIQQSTVNTTTVDLANASDGLDKKTSTQSHSKGGRAAAILVITHVIEIVAMVTGVILRILPQTLLTSSIAVSSEATSSSSAYDAPPEIIGIQLALLILPFTIVTSISLAWVLRGQDFSGRIFARLVCWLLHILQSSLIWRFLKIQIAFDPGDLSELKVLRFIQIHIHTLPCLVMLLFITLTFTRTFCLTLALSFTLLLSVATTIVVSTTTVPNSRLSTLAAPAIMQLCHPSFNNKITNLLSKNKLRLYVAFATVCILWSRVISMAALFCVHAVWGIALILIHWVVAVIWLCFQEKLTSNSNNSSKRVLKRGFLGYLLLWDWYIFKKDEEAITVCTHPRLPAVYYTIIASQNIAATCVWYISKRITNLSTFYTAIFASCVISQAIGLLLLGFSYLFFSTSFLSRWANKKSSMSVSRKPSLVNPSTKLTSSSLNTKLNENTDITLVLESPNYGDFSDFVEDASVVSASSNKGDKTLEHIDSKMKLPSPELIIPKAEILKDSNFPKSIAPRLMLNHRFSYTNDIIQQTSKSERSSTENGSFNSRNTNTLPASGSLVPDYETVHKPHGSFSDSFSSLSCGTVNKVMTSTPKGIIGTQLYPHNVKRLKHMKACQNSCCCGKLKDRKVNQCEEVKEEKHNELTSDAEPLSFASLDKGISPPRVAVVRATQRFQVVCSKCLDAHDPLLTRCKTQPRSSRPPSLSYSCGGELGGAGGDSSTDYPSDTELTTTIDTLSSISADSHSTYTTWPVGRGQGLAKLLMLEKGGHDYVTAWLWHQQTRGGAAGVPQTSSSSSRHVSFQNFPKNSYKTGTHPSPSKCSRITKRHGHRSKLRSPSLIQDLETIV